jgi:hypothetical protein
MIHKQTYPRQIMVSTEKSKILLQTLPNQSYLQILPNHLKIKLRILKHLPQPVQLNNKTQIHVSIFQTEDGFVLSVKTTILVEESSATGAIN